jgi:general secretion pathway protein J
MRARARGFTLLELIIGLALLGMMLLLLFGALRLASRSWDAGEKRLTEAGDRAQVAAFLRRTLAAAYPYQFKVLDAPPLAFHGMPDRLLFAGRVPTRQGIAGVHLIQLDMEGNGGAGKLTVRWRVPNPGASDFSSLDGAEPVVLMQGVTALRFAYFGSPEGTGEPRWHDTWESAREMPSLIALRLTPEKGAAWPELFASPKVGAGTACEWDALHQQCADPLLRMGTQSDRRSR